MGTVVKSREERELRCQLSESERHGKAERVAEILEQLDALDAEERSKRAGIKARREVLSAEKSLELDAYRTGHELRRVVCELVLDHETSTATLIRTDTGEPLASRPLRDDERQASLFAEAELAPPPAEVLPDPEVEAEPESESVSPGRRRGRNKGETAAAPAL